MKPDDFSSYWLQLEQELIQMEPAPECTEIPLRSNPEGKVFGLLLTSLGGYRIFAYYCVPHGKGPFPVIYRLPNYGSVVHIPPFEERCNHISIALCHRGQRLSDEPFAASYPGLLTQGIESPQTYIYREIASDCLRVMDFLLTREEVDHRRISLVGGDMALWTAAMRPQAFTLFYTPSMFYKSLQKASTSSHYPLEEFNDYFRTFPKSMKLVETTLEYFEPMNFAPLVSISTMMMEESEGDGDDLAVAFGRKIDRCTTYHSSFRDGVRQAKWIADKLKTGEPLLPEHWS
jgi:cephalosporin-C deacetylase